jgi:ABC-type sugar transport system permease subunit
MAAISATSADTARPPRSRRSRGRLRRTTRGDRIVLTLMVGIPTLIELVMVWGPALVSVVLGFTNARLDLTQQGGVHFVGGKNYHFIATEYPPFWPAIQHNVIWLLFLAIVATPLGLLLAVLLDSNLRGSRIYQSIFFVPVMLSLALVGIVWHLIYSPDAGLLNSLLGTAGTPREVDWFGDSRVNLWAALVAASWKHAGYIMILYLAGLKGIDPMLREAASLDGANARQTFFRVVFPAMRPINIVVGVITVIEALRAFDIVYVINRGTNGLELLSALVVQNLVGEGTRIGVGAAIATVLLVISLVPIVAYLNQAFRKEDR